MPYWQYDFLPPNIGNMKKGYIILSRYRILYIVPYYHDNMLYCDIVVHTACKHQSTKRARNVSEYRSSTQLAVGGWAFPSYSSETTSTLEHIVQFQPHAGKTFIANIPSCIENLRTSSWSICSNRRFHDQLPHFRCTWSWPYQRLFSLVA